MDQLSKPKAKVECYHDRRSQIWFWSMVWVTFNNPSIKTITWVGTGLWDWITCTINLWSTNTELSIKAGRNLSGRRQEVSVTIEARCYAAGFEDGGRGQQPRNARMRWEKPRKWSLPQSPRGKAVLLTPWFHSAQWNRFWISDLQNLENQMCAAIGHQVYSNFFFTAARS